MKRAFQLLLIVLLLLPLSASAQRFTYNYKGIDFSCRVKDGKAEIYRFDREVGQVLIPAEVTDKEGRTWPVQSVSLCSPDYAYKTKVVALEPGIQVIDDCCFAQFKNLAQIFIPNTIERIGKNVFYKKAQISFTMPNTIKESDLMAGLPVNLIVVDGKQQDITAAIDLSDYFADGSAAAQNPNTEAEPESKQNTAITPGTSDVDFNIPSSGIKRENTFCLIIGNEDYQQRDTPKVKYAMQDGKTFREYCIRTLGVPSEQVKSITNATYLQIKDALRWFKGIAAAYGDEANFIVYYAGHGIPDEKGHCRLLPTDVSINDANNAYSLTELYTLLGSLTSNNVLVLIDACFSGNDRGGDVALDDKHRGVMIEMKEDNVPDNVIVMTATSQQETALSYNAKGHGFFTYFLLKKLQETKGKVTYGELYNYIRREVSRKSVVVEQKKQTPSVTTSSSTKNSWESMTF